MGLNHPFPALYAITGASAIGYTVKHLCQENNFGSLATGSLVLTTALGHLYWSKLSMCSYSCSSY